MEAIRITKGAAVLLDAMRHGWNIAVTTPSDVRRIDDPGAVRTELRAGKATREDHQPKGEWNGRDGLILAQTPLVRAHGKGGVYLPGDVHAPVDIVSDDAFPGFLRRSDVTMLSAYAESGHAELAFCWGDTHLAVGMTSGERRTLARLVSGGAIDRLILDGTDIARRADGTVTIRRFDKDRGVDLAITGTELSKLDAVLQDMGEEAYRADVGMHLPGALHY